MTKFKNLLKAHLHGHVFHPYAGFFALYVIECRHTYPFALVDFCEHDDEPLGSVKCGEFDSFLPKKDLVD